MRILAVPQGTGSVTAVGRLRNNITQLGTTGIQGLQGSSQGTTLPGVLSLCQGPLSETGRSNTWHSLRFAFLTGQRGGVGASAPARCHHPVTPHTPAQVGREGRHFTITCTSPPSQSSTKPRGIPLNPHGHKLTPGTGRGGKRGVREPQATQVGWTTLSI